MNVLKNMHVAASTFRTPAPRGRCHGFGRGTSLIAAAGLALSAGVALGQDRQWVALDPTVGPGTAPSVVLSQASTEDKTILEISIPGFYVEQVVDPVHGAFQKLTIPQSTDPLLIGLLLPAVQKVREAAAVPVINMLLAIPSDSPGCSVATLTPMQTTTLSGYRIVPSQPDVMEEETVDPGIVPPFEYDPDAYASTVPYPSENGEAIGEAGLMSGIRVQGVSVKPFKFIGASNLLIAHSKFSVEIAHPGDPLPQTREHVLLARQNQATMVNWDTPAANWLTNGVDYKGAFLFITKDDVLDDLKPLVDQKKKRGYTTRVATYQDIDTSGNGALEWTEVRSYIKSWHDDHEEDALKYVVLVGDTNRIPNAVDPDYGYPSDYYYSCYEDDDFYADMKLGRITFNAGQLPDIIGRILAYEDAPPSSEAYYSKGLAIGHGEVAANFVKVLDESISIPFPADEPMSFTKAYGTEIATGQNVVVTDALNAGQHIVYYRGHGTPNTFFEWSYFGSNFVDTMLNDFNDPAHPSWCPIVISSACSNGALGSSDCLIEDWFQRPGNGAVAGYAGLIGSRRDMNHAFTRNFWSNLRLLGEASSIAHLMSVSQIFGYFQTVSPDMSDPRKNIWTYALLGDPEMKIWGKKPDHALPVPVIDQIPSGSQAFDITVKNGHGDPIPGAVVCAFKDGEVQATGYTNRSGVVTLDINPQSYGIMEVRAYTYDDRTQSSVARVQVGLCPADADGSGFVDTDDFDKFVEFFESGAIQADFDQSGFVDTDDFDAFVKAFEQGC